MVIATRGASTGAYATFGYRPNLKKKVPKEPQIMGGGFQYDSRIQWLRINARQKSNLHNPIVINTARESNLFAIRQYNMQIGINIQVDRMYSILKSSFFKFKDHILNLRVKSAIGTYDISRVKKGVQVGRYDIMRHIVGSTLYRELVS